jgi:hypothetical protein
MAYHSLYTAPDIVSVEPLHDLSICVCFADGVSVIYSFKQYAEDSDSIFSVLHDETVFRAVRIVHSAKAIQFPPDLDIHGSTIYHTGSRVDITDQHRL